MSNKIIILSLHKTGTSSTNEFFKSLGYKTFHYDFYQTKEYDKLNNAQKHIILEYARNIEKEYEVLSDVPFNIMYKYFNEVYPESKFILFERNIGDWIKSIRNRYLIKNSTNQYFNFHNIERIQYATYINSLPDSINQCYDKDLETMFINNSLGIKKYFKNKKDKLLVLDLDDEEKGSKILSFLGLESEVEFPKINITNWGEK